MKKLWIAVSLILCFALFLTACGKKKADPPAKSTTQSQAKSTPTKAPDVKATEAPKAQDKKADAPTVTKFTQISDFSEAWNDLYSGNEAVLNKYDGMPLMSLVTPALAFMSGVQYQLLNLDDKDGRFEGKLMLSGYQAVLEKSGRKLTFGYDDVLDKDGFGPSHKAGDRKVENGVFEMDKEFIRMESYTERSGAKIIRSYHEFKRLDDGSILCFDLSGSSHDARGEEKKSNTFVFIHNGADRYDFVIAKANTGPEFKTVSMENEKSLTLEKVIEMFEGAGYTIDKTGGIKDGAFFVNQH